MFGMKANYNQSLLVLVGRFSAVGVATHYGLDGQESNPGGGEIFLILPDRPRGAPNLPYKGYWVIPGGKRPESGVEHQPPSSAEDKGRVNLYKYPPSGPSWPVLGCIFLSFSFPLIYGFISVRFFVKNASIMKNHFFLKLLAF
jgi:hypothetical protein